MISLEPEDIQEERDFHLNRLHNQLRGPMVMSQSANKILKEQIRMERLWTGHAQEDDTPPSSPPPTNDGPPLQSSSPPQDAEDTATSTTPVNDTPDTSLAFLQPNTLPPLSITTRAAARAAARRAVYNAKPRPYTFVAPEGLKTAKDMKEDLSGFGFSGKKLKEVMAKKEKFKVDATGQRLFKLDSKEEGRGTRGRRESGKVAGDGGDGGGKYEHLSLNQDSNWVLFDPLHSYSRTRTPPAVMLKWDTYKIGNARILEYNTLSHSVRMRQTPAELEGKEVQYTRHGPKLVNEIKAGKLKRKQRKVEEEEPVKVSKRAKVVPDSSSELDDDEAASSSEVDEGAREIKDSQDD